MEDREVCLSIEAARNKAIAWLENLGVVFGPYHQIQIGRLGALAGKETGVESTGVQYWRIRLDYDPDKGGHYNVEFGKGPQRKKKAFTFPGGQALIAKLAKSRNPR